MTALIQRELFQLFIMFYGGMALMLLFTGRDSLMRRCCLLYTSDAADE